MHYSSNRIIYACLICLYWCCIVFLISTTGHFLYIQKSDIWISQPFLSKSWTEHNLSLPFFKKQAKTKASKLTKWNQLPSSNRPQRGNILEKESGGNNIFIYVCVYLKFLYFVHHWYFSLTLVFVKCSLKYFLSD